MQLNKIEKVLLNNFKNACHLLRWFLDEYVVKLHTVSTTAYLEMIGLTAVAFQEGTDRNLMNALKGIDDSNVVNLENGEVQLVIQLNTTWQVRITMAPVDTGMQVMVSLESKSSQTGEMEVDFRTNFTVLGLVH